MAVRFIIGRSGSGKTKFILDEIKKSCTDNPQGHPIQVIVPDQMTFDLEYQLLKQNEAKALMRVQGLSFNRLAYRVLQETGGMIRYHLDHVGIAILLQKIMTEQKDNLKRFKSFANKPGFVLKMGQMISEFKSYQIDAKLLTDDHVINDFSKESQGKIQDISFLYEQFLSLTSSKYLIDEDYYQLLIEKIASSALIASSDFYIDGYHIFNKQEELILVQLAKYAKSVTIVLTHDEESESSYFALPRKTFKRLKELFVFEQLTYEIHRQNEAKPLRYNEHKGLAHLERHFLDLPVKPINSQDVSFFHASNSRVEVEEVATRIHQLIQSKQAAYSDIAIYVQDETHYYDLIHAIFETFEIPVFLDYKEKMIYHPILTFMYHLIDVIEHEWRYDALFLLLKTTLFMDVSQIETPKHYERACSDYLLNLDVLENYCLSRHVTKKLWNDETPWEYAKYQGLNRGYIKTTDDELLEVMLNEMKTSVATKLLPFEKNFKKAKSYKQKCIALFEFMEQLEIPKHLLLMKQLAEQNEDFTLSKQHDQVWNKVLHLFEELAEVGADDVASVADFSRVIQAGIQEMSYATVPSTLDQVYVGTCKRARYQLTHDVTEQGRYGIKHAFVLGVNEGQMPKTPIESSLLNESEREILKKHGIELAPSLEQTFEDELFILYTVFTSARNSLTLSYISSNDEGESFLASYVYTQLKEMFKDVQEVPVSRVRFTDLYEQLTTPKHVMPQLIRELKADATKYEYYSPILSYFEKIEPQRFELIQRATHYENKATSLTHDETLSLYTDEINASVSRIEQFNKCEFAHFVNYGLKARERDQYKLDLPHIGELYHEALKRIALLIETENKSFADLSENECFTLAKVTSEELADKLLFKILKRDRRMVILKDKLIQVIYKTLVGLKYQSTHSQYQPRFFELPFGLTSKTKNAIQVKSHTLSTGFKFSLRGVIDRIDIAYLDEQAYLRIVDYKSSAKELELDKVYFGLNLQLLTYLDVAVSHAIQLIDTDALVGGLHYFHVHQPFVSENEKDILQVEDVTKTLHDRQMSDYKMKGYILDDIETATLADTRIVTDLKSDIVPMTLKKDGSFAQKGNKSLTQDQLDTLREYSNHKMIQSATEITKGNIAINPITHKSENACTFCHFRQVCQFDPDFSGNKKNVLPKISDEHLFDVIHETLQKGEK